MIFLIPRILLQWVTQHGWKSMFLLARRRGRLFTRYWQFRIWIWFFQNKNQNSPSTPKLKTSPLAPVFSVALVAYRTPLSWLRDATTSLQNQSFTDWELWIGLCEVSKEVRLFVHYLSREDPRIHWLELEKNFGISENSNAICQHTKGEFLCILDHDDFLEPNALLEMYLEIQIKKPDIIYSDEDLITNYFHIPILPALKPNWAPDSFLSHNYICHLCFFRRSIFMEIGGFRSKYDGAQDYDLFLRISEKTKRIIHVPKILYHWRRHPHSAASGSQAKPFAWEACRLAVESHLHRTGVEAHVKSGAEYGTVRVSYPILKTPLVDIILSSPKYNDSINNCVNQILNKTQYPNFRITIVVEDNKYSKSNVSFPNFGNRIFFLTTQNHFNNSLFRNNAASDSTGSILLFLSENLKIIQQDWIEGLVEHAQRPEIGCVGPMLLDQNGRITHTGFVLDEVHAYWEPHRGLPQNNGGYNLRAQTIQNVSAVSAFCLCTRKNVFEEVNGFDLDLTNNNSAVDFCMKLLKSSYRIIYTPYVRFNFSKYFYHNCSSPAEIAEKKLLFKKWSVDSFQDNYFKLGFLKPKTSLKQLAKSYLRISR